MSKLKVIQLLPELNFGGVERGTKDMSKALISEGHDSIVISNGGIFEKDILNLVYLCRFYGLNEVADYWRNVVEINSWQQKRVYEIIVRKLFGNLADKKIAILGFAFKKNTNDTRESPAISIVKELLENGADLCIHDPQVSESQISEALFGKNMASDKKTHEGNWTYTNDLKAGSRTLEFKTSWPIHRSRAAPLPRKWRVTPSITHRTYQHAESCRRHEPDAHPINSIPSSWKLPSGLSWQNHQI